MIKNLEAYLRSGLFFAAMVLSGIVIACLTLLAYPFGFEARYRVASLWVRFVLASLKRICQLDYTVQGAEHVPPGNCIVLSKHQSTWETIGLQTVFKPVCFILKRELLRIPFWGWAMASLQPIAIDRQARSAAIKQVLREGEARLKSGRWLVLFPEGTRVAPGARGRYGGSGGMLAQRSGYPVIPVAHNAGEFWPRHGFLKRPGTIQVRIGPPIQTRGLSAAEINARVERWIEDQMSEISLKGTPVAADAFETGPTR